MMKSKGEVYDIMEGNIHNFEEVKINWPDHCRKHKLQSAALR